MILFEDVHKSFGEKKVLRGIDLEIKEGKITVVMGPSGSGKSTIIKHIVGLLRPTSGKLLVNNLDMIKATEKEIAKLRQDVGFLFQHGALFDSMNIFDNIAFPLREHTKKSKSQIQKEVHEQLELVGLDLSVAKLFPNEISGGMQKRVGLARTIVMKPKVILYDEPTSGLDPIASDLISKLIMKLRDELGITSVVISHDIRESFKIADYMAMIYDGKIIEYGEPKVFEDNANPIVKQFIEGVS
ncbi:MAG: Methionine ABC transporter ATP-binding protein [uncultured Campylobacterales bacterium]|uniref:Methionine ABC transporter ATP-binding protein n=1 Tax=uncultured Campylobacterales bacterium TaxID=352960 RepID=A0A6S6SQB5_9BACT|nr:MAG: Methionine ABC transporter ATP-binding protein [uncultured Campylobacterales bacterium]